MYHPLFKRVLTARSPLPAIYITQSRRICQIVLAPLFLAKSGAFYCFEGVDPRDRRSDYSDRFVFDYPGKQAFVLHIAARQGKPDFNNFFVSGLNSDAVNFEK